MIWLSGEGQLGMDVLNRNDRQLRQINRSSFCYEDVYEITGSSTHNLVASYKIQMG